MAETDILWLHSNGADNKNPNLDLGGLPSKFQIEDDLFDDVTPAQTLVGRTDYRCFYIYNKLLDETVTDATLALTSDNLCSAITFGSTATNEVQELTIIGQPETNGFMILQSPYGGPTITCTFPGSWSGFSVVLQDNLRLLPYHDSVTVTASSTADYATYTITYLGRLARRQMDLLQLVQNDLVSIEGREYRIGQFVPNPPPPGPGPGPSPFNNAGDSTIVVSQAISTDHPVPGTLYVFNVNTGLYVQYTYSAISGTDFTLTTPLTFNLVHGDELWVTMPSDQRKSIVNITRTTLGSPINRIANVIESETSLPDSYVDQGASFNVGMLRPNDGFFIWVRRITQAEKVACSGTFDLNLTGTTEPYPL